MSFLPVSFNANTLIGLTAALLIGFAAVRKWAAGGQCTSRRKLDGKTVLITGANSGIGFQTALDLARRRARVTIACRSAPLMEAAVAELRARSSNPNVHGMLLDLGDLAQVREFAARFVAAEARLDILVLNAGVMAVPVHTKTKDGFEMQMGTNHFGHFLLTSLLLGVLKRTGRGARVVTVSSRAHRRATGFHIDDLNHERPGAYAAFEVYSQSKLANVLFSNELARRLEADGISCFSLHPGVVRTELGRHLPAWLQLLLRTVCFVPLHLLMKSPKEGAQTSVFCCVDESLDGKTGLYLVDCKPLQPGDADYHPLATDAALAAQLWAKSEAAVKL